MALRRFEPMTPPAPHFEALWNHSWVMFEYLTRFSPAGPMTATANSSPVSPLSSSLRAYSDLCLYPPQYFEASLIWTSSSKT